MATNRLEKDLVKFISSYRDVTFPDLQRSFPNYFNKKKGKNFHKGKKLAWKGLSPDMAESLVKLQREGILKSIETKKERYTLEGYEIKQKSWVPLAFVFQKELPDHGI